MEEALEKVSKMSDDEINLNGEDHEITDFSGATRGRFYVGDKERIMVGGKPDNVAGMEDWRNLDAKNKKK